MTFDDFWAAWPSAHRVGKKQAVDQWDKLSMFDQDSAVEDVTWRTAHESRWQRPDPKDGRWAIPHPFRYLRDRRFEDARTDQPSVIGMPAYRAPWCRHYPKCGTPEMHELRLAKGIAEEPDDE